MDVNIKIMYLDSLELSVRKTMYDKYNVDLYNKDLVLKKSI